MLYRMLLALNIMFDVAPEFKPIVAKLMAISEAQGTESIDAYAAYEHIFEARKNLQQAAEREATKQKLLSSKFFNNLESYQTAVSRKQTDKEQAELRLRNAIEAFNNAQRELMFQKFLSSNTAASDFLDYVYNIRHKQVLGLALDGNNCIVLEVVTPMVIDAAQLNELSSYSFMRDQEANNEFQVMLQKYMPFFKDLCEGLVSLPIYGYYGVTQNSGVHEVYNKQGDEANALKYPDKLQSKPTMYNIHVVYFNCWSAGKLASEKAFNQGNHTTGLEYLLAANADYNLFDGSVMGKFAYAFLANEKLEIAELPNGVRISPYDYMKTKEVPNETTEVGPGTDRENIEEAFIEDLPF